MYKWYLNFEDTAVWAVNIIVYTHSYTPVPEHRRSFQRRSIALKQMSHTAWRVQDYMEHDPVRHAQTWEWVACPQEEAEVLQWPGNWSAAVSPSVKCFEWWTAVGAPCGWTTLSVAADMSLSPSLLPSVTWNRWEKEDKREISHTHTHTHTHTLRYSHVESLIQVLATFLPLHTTGHILQNTSRQHEYS